MGTSTHNFQRQMRRTAEDAGLILIMPPQLGLLGGFSTSLIPLAAFVAEQLPVVQIELLDLSEIVLLDVEERIRETLLSMSCSRLIVGITTTTASYQSALTVARAVKKLQPDAKVVLGGSHAGADAETVLRNHPEIVDYIVAGEGEKPLVDLLAHPEAVDIPGLAYLVGGHFVQQPPAPFLEQEELNRLPLTFRQSGVVGTPGKFGHVTYVSARGCPWRCAFCAVGCQRIRAKSVERVVKDVRELVGMGFSSIAIEDNLFAHSSAKTHVLCLALAALREGGLHFSWDCQTRVESLARPGMVSRMAKAGCEAVYIGVESLIPDHLRYLGKTTNPLKYLEQLEEVVVPNLLASSVDCYLNIQLGLPGETTDHHDLTLNMLEKLGTRAVQYGKVITIFPQLHVVYPGTVLFWEGLRKGRFSSNMFETFTEWEAHQEPVLTWLGDHFAHGTGGVPDGVLGPGILREGNYIVDSEVVLRITNCLTAMEKIRGLSVFRYSDYLVGRGTALKGKLAQARLSNSAAAAG